MPGERYEAPQKERKHLLGSGRAQPIRANRRRSSNWATISILVNTILYFYIGKCLSIFQAFTFQAIGPYGHDHLFGNACCVLDVKSEEEEILLLRT